MRYRLEALTPLLAGDGQKLSPIDYMVWKDQINVLDQRRIFRLLAKGPRLEGYLAQIRKAEKLDFASWGGFAQNFAGRRIPFEHSSLTPVWEQARTEHLHIPVFASGPSGPYLPATTIKGALRTAMAASRWNASTLKQLSTRMESDRPPRRLGEAAEAMTMASSGKDAMRPVTFGDSATVTSSVFKIFLLRVANLEARGAGKIELGWKPAPTFAEMAVPGTEFQGEFRIDGHAEKFLQAANENSAKLLEIHRDYAERAGLGVLAGNLDQLQQRLAQARSGRSSCLINLGWGGGFLGKTAFPDTESEDYRKILRQVSAYSSSIRTGFPFPKTRRVVHLNSQPATLPGWALLEL